MTEQNQKLAENNAGCLEVGRGKCQDNELAGEVRTHSWATPEQGAGAVRVRGRRAIWYNSWCHEIDIPKKPTEAHCSCRASAAPPDAHLVTMTWKEAVTSGCTLRVAV